jgi:arginine/lysine/ornithine decarboxylase
MNPLNLNCSSSAQAATPILEALRIASQQDNAAFYAPGHKKGTGINSLLRDWWGKAIFQADLPELPELDNLFAPQGVIEQAQNLAAECFGAEQTWFLVNGSTCGIMAAILAVCGEADKIILPRNIHQSAIAGLILAGAIPLLIDPEYDPIADMIYSITPTTLENTLQQHPDTKAVMILHPSYQGICGNLEAIAEITHRYDLPLIVDEAHGAHFAFHPDLPSSALSKGADLTIQSTHKVLGAMTQASMLHLQGNRIAPQKISQALQLVESTSPSYLLLASLDAARQQMALQGKQLMTQTLQLAAMARTKLAAIPYISVLEFEPKPGFSDLDLTRLTINLAQLGITGYEADAILHEQLGVTCELPSLNHLTFIISLGNTEADIERLIQGCTTLAQSGSSSHSFSSPWSLSLPISHPCLSPRQAFFAAKESIPLTESGDRLCGELICPYPPGIPILMPGEMITTKAINYLQQVLNSGGVITGCSDPTLQNILVISD